MIKHIFKILTIAPLFVATLGFAATENISDYFYKAGGIKTVELEKLLKTDSKYIEGLVLMYDKSTQKSKKITVEGKEITTQVVDYKGMFEAFLYSAKSKANPVSAYQALHLLKTRYFKTAKEYKNYYNLSKLLYDGQKEMCSSYLDYGAIFEKGFYHKVELKKALSIYQEAIERKVCSDWQKRVLQSKIVAIGNQVKMADIRRAKNKDK